MTGRSLFCVFGRRTATEQPAPVTGRYHERIEDAQRELRLMAGRGEWVALQVWSFAQR